MRKSPRTRSGTVPRMSSQKLVVKTNIKAGRGDHRANCPVAGCGMNHSETLICR